MQAIKSAFTSLHRHRRWILPAAGLLCLAGCAQIPTFDKAVEA